MSKSGAGNNGLQGARDPWDGDFMGIEWLINGGLMVV
jgi:hypothetical protein